MSAGGVDGSDEVAAVLGRLLERALEAMNDAVVMTETQGPAAAIEFIADYLNNSDAVDERTCSVASDWLDRWTVTR